MTLLSWPQRNLGAELSVGSWRATQVSSVIAVTAAPVSLFNFNWKFPIVRVTIQHGEDALLTVYRNPVSGMSGSTSVNEAGHEILEKHLEPNWPSLICKAYFPSIALVVTASAAGAS